MPSFCAPLVRLPNAEMMRPCTGQRNDGMAPVGSALAAEFSCATAPSLATRAFSVAGTVATGAVGDADATFVSGWAGRCATCCGAACGLAACGAFACWIEAPFLPGIVRRSPIDTFVNGLMLFALASVLRLT